MEEITKENEIYHNAAHAYTYDYSTIVSLEAFPNKLSFIRL
jgi:hypothetical protein